MRIKVTQDHIDRGHERNGSSCPIALAIGEMGMDSVFVGSNITFSCPTFGVVSERTPPVAVQFICEFDSELPVEPFEFDLPLKASVASVGHHHKET